MTISERFLAVIDDIQAKSSLSQSEIERRCGMSAVVSNVRNGKVEPSLLTVCKLLKTFPKYDPDWLLLERGSMYRDDSELGRLRDENEMLLRLNIKLQEKLIK